MVRTYRGPITHLSPNQIFVFGSNTQGRHGKGAALWALKNAGAIYGKAEGLQGNSYAIITKDLTKSTHPSVSKEFIIEQIVKLYRIALANPDKMYLIAYSGSGTNLNGYTSVEMAKMFAEASKQVYIPYNIVFEESFQFMVWMMHT